MLQQKKKKERARAKKKLSSAWEIYRSKLYNKVVSENSNLYL